MTWFVYIIECKDQTLYTGITTDLVRRLAEHNVSDKLGAKYTRIRRPVLLVHSETCSDRSEACKREIQIKKLTRLQKKRLYC